MSPPSSDVVDFLQPRSADTDHPTTTGRKPPSNPTIRVLMRSPSFLVVAKPPDLRIDGEFNHTVAKLALHHLSQNTPLQQQEQQQQQSHDTSKEPQQTPPTRIYFPHRLDYATSGVIVLSLSRPATALASFQFQERTVQKLYIALLHGTVTDAQTIDHPIADTQPPSFRMTIGSSENPGRRSVTDLIPLQCATYHGVPVTKVALIPRTGRRHQLRVHCKHIAHPIVGDATYISDEEEAQVYAESDKRVPPWCPPRMMLHAARLRIRLPDSFVHGRKSAMRQATWKLFDAGDPFDAMPGLQHQNTLYKGGLDMAWSTLVSESAKENG